MIPYKAEYDASRDGRVLWSAWFINARQHWQQVRDANGAAESYGAYGEALDAGRHKWFAESVS